MAAEIAMYSPDIITHTLILFISYLLENPV